MKGGRLGRLLAAAAALALAMTPRAAHADDAQPAATTPKPVVALRFDGGYAPRKLVALSVKGASAGVGVGVQLSRRATVWGTTRLFFGSTENGLDVRSGSAGVEAELVLRPVRFALGVHASVLGVGRVTRDKTILGWGPLATAAARVDVIDADAFALFLRAGVDVAVELGNGNVFWGPTVGAGFDFDVTGRRATLR